MRHHWIPSLLLTTCCLAWQTSLAQRVAVAPITPKVTTVLLAAPAYQGVAVDPAAASRSASHLEPEPTRYWPAPQPDPLYIVNEQIIVDNSFSTILPNDIEKLYVYKGGSDTPRKWRSLARYGIIAITLKAERKPEVKTQTLTQIGKGLEVSGPVSYSINGMPVGDPDLRIATTAIAEVKVTRPTPTEPNALVDIQIVHRPPTPLAPDPSGKPRIMIRGTAAL